MRRRLLQMCALIAVLSGSMLSQDQLSEARRLHEKLLDDILNLKGEQRALIPEEERSIPAKIQALLSTGIPQLLDGGANASQLQAKLQSVLAVAPGDTSSGYASVLSVAGSKSPSFIVAYGISYCVMCSKTWLGVYERGEHGYSNTVAFEEPLRNHTVYLHSLPAAIGEVPRIMLYGTGLGSYDNPLTAISYELSQGKITQFWSLENLNNGTIKFEDRMFVVTDLVPSATDSKIRDERTREYRITPEGILLASTSQRPAD